MQMPFEAVQVIKMSEAVSTMARLQVLSSEDLQKM